MIGLSGGGWSTTLAAALDVRIELSFPVAGGLPFEMYNPVFDSRDFEQEPERPIYQIVDYVDEYVLGGLGEFRSQVQLLHEMDPCCWCACTRHTKIKEYNHIVSEVHHSSFRTVVTAGNLHEVNERDFSIISWLIGLYDIGMNPKEITKTPIPHNLLY